MSTWSEKSKSQAVETRRRNASVNLVGRRYRVSAIQAIPHAGQLIEIVAMIRPGYLWKAKAEDGTEFEVHTHWLNSTCVAEGAPKP